MRLTVAARVIGGFAIITGLLLVISLSSFFSLQTIGRSSEQVNDVAIPSLIGVANIQTELLQLSNNQTEAFYSSRQATVEQLQADFSRASSNVDSQLNQLRQLLTSEAQSRAVNNVSTDVSQFTRQVATIFESQAEFLRLASRRDNRLNEVELAADDAAMLLLDLTDTQGLSDELYNQAGLLENNLNSLVTLAYDMVSVEEAGRADIIRSEIEVAVQSSRERLADMQQMSSRATLDEVADYLDTAAGALLENSDSLVAAVLSRLEARSAAERLLGENNDLMDNILSEMATLQVQVQRLADDVRGTASGAIARSAWMNSVLTILSIAFAIGIGYLAVRSISRPLAEVNAMLNTLANGDLTGRLDDSSQDEFGTLATNINKLIENLRRLIEGIADRSTQLATAAEESSSVSAQSRNSIQEQRAQVEQVAAATTEMSSTTAEMASGAAKALDEIQHSDEEAKRVRIISDENKRTIEALAEEIKNASDVINQLSENSANIGGILDVIRGIAEQTNLLALNAAIEAARAGEQGRGFAVVADEVRTLASRTQQSTEEIQTMIERLQSDSSRAVSVMQRGRTQAETCVTQTDEAAIALQAITESVHQASDSSTAIATAAEQQSATAQDISEKLEAIVTIAEQAEAGARQTAQASDEVAKLSAEMQDSVKSFRL
ncbi:MAG: methyl-accepting chemotaxis protein [Firmicutes bacterium]|nr:methyl-accepting chemotaxis protein [Bacillota bacterium]